MGNDTQPAQPERAEKAEHRSDDAARDYYARHRKLIGSTLDDPARLRCFRTPRRRWQGDRHAVPPGYGIGLDERVVEYPWALAQKPTGRCLDAGAVLNHADILPRFIPCLDELRIATAGQEPDHGIPVENADLRHLPYPDRCFDTVICLSTLEHVGMDNATYGGGARTGRPEEDVDRAVAELRRVLAPRGALLVSVPFGRLEDHGWFRQFGIAEVARLMAGDRRARLAVFGYRPSGWHRCAPEEVADARYATDPHATDGAVAARAVACLRLGRV